MAGALPKPNDPVVPAAAAGCEPKAGVAAWFVDEGCPKAKLGAPDVGAATDAAGLLAFPNENEGVVELGAGVALPFGAPKLKPAEDEAGAALLPPKLKPDCKALEVTAGLPKEKLGALLVGGADGTLDGDSSIKSVGKGAIPVGGVFLVAIGAGWPKLKGAALDAGVDTGAADDADPVEDAEGSGGVPKENVGFAALFAPATPFAVGFPCVEAGGAGFPKEKLGAEADVSVLGLANEKPEPVLAGVEAATFTSLDSLDASPGAAAGFPNENVGTPAAAGFAFSAALSAPVGAPKENSGFAVELLCWFLPSAAALKLNSGLPSDFGVESFSAGFIALAKNDGMPDFVGSGSFVAPAGPSPERLPKTSLLVLVLPKAAVEEGVAEGAKPKAGFGGAGAAALGLEADCAGGSGARSSATGCFAAGNALKSFFGSAPANPPNRERRD